MTVEYRIGRTSVVALEKVSFQVRQEELVAIVGESGSGKSTLALSIIGLLPPSASTTGQILFETLESRIDWVFWWEDFAHGRGPNFSPKLFKEFILPNLKKVTSFLNKNGIDLIIVDSDGDFRVLMPLLWEGGIVRTGLVKFLGRQVLIPRPLGTWCQLEPWPELRSCLKSNG